MIDFTEAPASSLNPNYYTDNAPPDSGEGLKLDDYGHVEGHPNWGQWIHRLNLWIHQTNCPCEWRWDASKRVWVKDTVEAIWGV